MDWMEWPQLSFVFLIDHALVGEIGLLSSAARCGIETTVTWN
jgi:hypothetical protein